MGYSAKYDFIKKTVDFKGSISDSIKLNIVNYFNDSFKQYNLNWHSDLIIFTLLPFRNNQTIVIDFYDPGFGKVSKVYYSINKSETIKNNNGDNIDCWVMEHDGSDPKFGNFIQRFWISKTTNEVLKEEDKTPNGFRYKLKIGVASEE